MVLDGLVKDDDACKTRKDNDTTCKTSTDGGTKDAEWSWMTCKTEGSRCVGKTDGVECAEESDETGKPLSSCNGDMNGTCNGKRMWEKVTEIWVCSFKWKDSFMKDNIA